MSQNSEFGIQNSEYGSDRRRGVALIVVLGFLSIMIVMAVAFLTQARVERQVSDATLEAMRGRQLVRTALHAAMNDYSAELAAAQLAMAPTNSSYDMFVSVPPSSLFGLGGRKIGEDNVDLLVGEVEDWIPRRYYTNDPYYAKTSVTNEAEWILVREDPSTPQPSRILGRYAYVCFDMSGGIDANLVARDPNVAGDDVRAASNRIRRSVRQVPMALLPETLNASQFKSYRQGWKGFDSLYALIRLTDGYPNDGNLGSDTRWQPERKEGASPAALNSNLVSDLTPFSLSVFRGGRYNPASATWTTPILCGSQPWSTVLNPISSQFAPQWNTWINKAIDDYTNGTKQIPAGVDYPSPKNVPMFNEIDLTYELNAEPDPINPGWCALEMEVRLTPEFWYPFPSESNVSSTVFQMDPPTIDGGPAGSGAGQIWFQMLAPGLSGVLGMAPPAMPGPLDVRAKYNNGKPYVASGTTNFSYTIPLERTGYPTTGPGAPPDSAYPFPNPMGVPLMVISISIPQPIYLTAGGGKADMIPGGLVLAPSASPLVIGTPSPTRVLEVTDPRLNHLSGQWVVAGSPTLAAMNIWGGAMKAKYQAEGTNLFCRNGAMHTPAELGYISTGKEWETIDICTPAAVGVLANLVADTNLYSQWITNNVFYTNGTINPNTRSSNVLASAFYELSTHEVPDVDAAKIGGNPVSANVAQYIAQDILKTTKTGTVSTVFQAGSDWARIPAMQKGGALVTVLNNNQRESLVRNTWGLFSPDNSLFTVVMVAQAIKEAPESVDPVGSWNPDLDMVTGERRAVALVWRDPFKNGSNLHHEMFVRMFRYLND